MICIEDRQPSSDASYTSVAIWEDLDNSLSSFQSESCVHQTVFLQKTWLCSSETSMKASEGFNAAYLESLPLWRFHNDEKLTCSGTTIAPSLSLV
jgi:hypothetical protein